MKTIIFLILVSFMMAFSQSSVRTETASNKYKYYSTAQTGDTLFTKAAAVSGSSIPDVNTVGALVGIVIGTPVSKDTITILNGVGTVFQTILDSVYTGAPNVRYTFPLSISLPARLDTSLIYIQKKTSSVTLIYRLKY